MVGQSCTIDKTIYIFCIEFAWKKIILNSKIPSKGIRYCSRQLSWPLWHQFNLAIHWHHGGHLKFKYQIYYITSAYKMSFGPVQRLIECQTLAVTSDLRFYAVELGLWKQNNILTPIAGSRADWKNADNFRYSDSSVISWPAVILLYKSKDLLLACVIWRYAEA